jgi:micrococcal nuclease
MKKMWIIIISIVVIIILLGMSYLIIKDKPATNDLIEIPEECYNSPLMVERVIDGDTFLLCSGDTIRLLCVDTPEEGEPGYEEAKIFLENIILHKQVELVTSDSNVNTDKYERLLRWVYIANESSDGEWIFINKYILEEEYGDLLVIPPETCNLVTD